MPSSARRRPPTAAWSVDDASTFAAQKEFKLLQLLSTDKKALSTARRLGLFSKQPQPHKETARSGAAAAATSARRQPDAASGRPVGPNSAQRRSAARSAQHHAQLQLRFYRTAIAALYFCRLRGGGAGCAPIWPTSSPSRAARFMRARALCPCSLRLLWGRLARSERTDLHHLPPLLWLRGPPVPAVMRCMGVSTVPSARLCCSDRASPGSSRARRRPRRPTQVACDARATAPVPAEES